jgi:hypothetical protein
MWDSDTTPDPDRPDAHPFARNYSLSRFAWSLRGLPDNIQAVWVIYVPLAPLIDTMMKPGRTNPLPGVGNAALVTQTAVARACVSRTDGSVTFVEADAVASLTRFEGRVKDIVVEFPMLETVPLDRKGLSGIPGYFRE